MFYVQRAEKNEIRDVMVRNISRKSTLHTDESRLYVETGKEFDRHLTIKHTAGEYVRYAEHVIHTTRSRTCSQCSSAE